MQVYGVVLVAICFAGRVCGSDISERVLELYAGLEIASVTAVSTNNDGRIVSTVSRDGSYSYVQYNKEQYQNIYREHRDVETEWENYPAFFSYYDGNLGVVKSAAFDPSEMYETLNLKERFALGSPIQVKACLWPLLPDLFKEGVVGRGSNGLNQLRVDSIATTLIFDDDGLLREVVWGDTSSVNGYVGRWKFSEYSEVDGYPLPGKLIQTMAYETDGVLEEGARHAHSTLNFDLDAARNVKRLLFVDETGSRSRLDAETSDVFDTDGNFIYNQDEMAAEYLAALGKGNPKRNRWIMLSVLGVVVVGSVWGLRKRVA
jgi:hypothetical protein